MNFKEYVLLEKYIEGVKLKSEKPLYHNLNIILDGKKIRVNAQFFLVYTCIVHDVSEGGEYDYHPDTTIFKSNDTEVSFEEFKYYSEEAKILAIKDVDIYDCEIKKAYDVKTGEKYNQLEQKVRLKLKWYATKKFKQTELLKLKADIKRAIDNRWVANYYNVQSNLRHQNQKQHKEEDNIPM